MAVITPQIEQELIDHQRHNRYEIPPAVMAGIGKYQSAVAPSMFGGMSGLDPAPNQPLGATPEQLTGWAKILPAIEASNLSPEGI